MLSILLGTSAQRLSETTQLKALCLLPISARKSRKTLSGAFSTIMASRVFVFPSTVIMGGLKDSDSSSLRMSTVLKRPLKPQMALISRDEVSIWIIIEILWEGVVEVADLAIEVAVVEVVVLAACLLKAVVLPPLKAKKSSLNLLLKTKKSPKLCLFSLFFFISILSLHHVIAVVTPFYVS